MLKGIAGNSAGERDYVNKSGFMIPTALRSRIVEGKSLSVALSIQGIYESLSVFSRLKDRVIKKFENAKTVINPIGSRIPFTADISTRTIEYSWT